jgi:hypothetical protein
MDVNEYETIHANTQTQVKVNEYETIHANTQTQVKVNVQIVKSCSLKCFMTS